MTATAAPATRPALSRETLDTLSLDTLLSMQRRARAEGRYGRAAHIKDYLIRVHGYEG